MIDVQIDDCAFIHELGHEMDTVHFTLLDYNHPMTKYRIQDIKKDLGTSRDLMTTSIRNYENYTYTLEKHFLWFSK